jgi:hypothetical protein
LHCQECAVSESTDDDPGSFLTRATVTISNPRLMALFVECLSRIPKNGNPIRLDTDVRLRKRGHPSGLVGLTTFRVVGYSTRGAKQKPSGSHTLTFYGDLMGQLSDRAVMAVMAHELAHAWLNENVSPEASTNREEDADILAEMWGFEAELKSLAEETEPVTC